MNGDGKPDLVTANMTSDNLGILLGNGDGTFQAPIYLKAGGGPRFVALADFNGDGKPDAAIADVSGDTVVVLIHPLGQLNR